MAPPRAGRALRVLKALGSACLLGAAIAYVGHQGDSEELGSALHDLRPGWILAAILAQFIAVGFGVLRWQWLTQAEGRELPLRWFILTYLKGRFVGVFTPSTTGLDAYRILAVRRYTGDTSCGSRPILAEKVFGLLALGLVACPCISLSSVGMDQEVALLSTLGLVGATLIGLSLLRQPHRLATLVVVLPKRVRPLATRGLELVSLERLDFGTSIKAALLSVGSHTLTAAVFVFSALALGIDAPPDQLFLTGVLIILGTLLPITMGGIGVREGLSVTLLGAVGVAAPPALLAGTLAFLCTQPPALVGGILSLWPPYTKLEATSRSVAV